ncbi:hypothetical protein D3C75_693760 [compost metagenome]
MVNAFCGAADENDRPVFHNGQQSLLDVAFQSVNLVDQHNGFVPVELKLIPGIIEGFPQLRNGEGDGIELDKIGFGHMADNRGQGGFAGGGRPLEDHGGDSVRLNQHAQGFALAHQMLLPRIFVQRHGAHTLSQRLEAFVLGLLH